MRDEINRLNSSKRYGAAGAPIRSDGTEEALVKRLTDYYKRHYLTPPAWFKAGKQERAQKYQKKRPQTDYAYGRNKKFGYADKKRPYTDIEARKRREAEARRRRAAEKKHRFHSKPHKHNYAHNHPHKHKEGPEYYNRKPVKRYAPANRRYSLSPERRHNGRRHSSGNYRPVDIKTEKRNELLNTCGPQCFADDNLTVPICPLCDSHRCVCRPDCFDLKNAYEKGYKRDKMLYYAKQLKCTWLPPPYSPKPERRRSSIRRSPTSPSVASPKRRSMRRSRELPPKHEIEIGMKFKAPNGVIHKVVKLIKGGVETKGDDGNVYHVPNAKVLYAIMADDDL